MVLNPLTLLAATLLVTALGGIIFTFRRSNTASELMRLARDWHMHYSRRDVFDLAPRIAAHLPVSGAADVRVRDLIYGNEPGGHRYVFSAEFTVGVVRSKCRRQCVVSILEPRGRHDVPVWSSIQIAPEELPLIEQYQSLKPSEESQVVSGS